jgi:hypothetical protein
MVANGDRSTESGATRAGRPGAHPPRRRLRLPVAAVLLSRAMAGGAMALSSAGVVANSLRLRTFRAA